MTIAAFFFHHWLFHPMIGKGYAFWSGVGSDISEITLLIGLAAYLHSRNCHQPRCPRLSWHPHPDHGHPVCKRHFPNEHMPGRE